MSDPKQIPIVCMCVQAMFTLAMFTLNCHHGHWPKCHQPQTYSEVRA